MIGFFRKRLVVRIVAVVTLVITIIAVGSMLLQVANMKLAAQEAISSYNIQIAQSYVNQLDTASYAEFAKDPKENDEFLKIRDELDDFRVSIGAMYVYFVKIDDKGTPLIMVDGMKDADKASPINEVTDVPQEAVQKLLQGQTASSSIINNEEYGDYISSYAPMLDSNGAVTGVIGIDTAVSVIGSIESDIMKSSIPFYALLLLITLIGIAVVTWFIVRGLRPLQPLKASVEKMAQGELAEANQILTSYRLRSQDEIGTTYQAMIHMSGNLNKIVSNMVEGVAVTTDILSESTKEFNRSTEEMLEMGKTVDQSVEQIRQGARTQKQGASDSAHAMEEIAKGITDISESSMVVSDAATSALSTAESGKQSMTMMKTQMESISNVSSEVVAMVQVLNNYSQEIGVPCTRFVILRVRRSCLRLMHPLRQHMQENTAKVLRLWRMKFESLLRPQAHPWNGSPTCCFVFNKNHSRSAHRWGLPHRRLDKGLRLPQKRSKLSPMWLMRSNW